jgi:putative ABC transport system substrate-binding protein
MQRRAFLRFGGACIAAVAGPEIRFVAHAAARGNAKRPIVGYLGSGYPAHRSSPAFANLFASLATGLRQTGYIDGDTVTMEWRFAEERYERLPDLAADLVRLGVDVIFTPSDHSAAAARQATRTIPIVFVGAVDPVKSEFAASLGRPRWNMTGLTEAGGQVTGKRLGLLKEAVPGMTRVAILGNPSQTSWLAHLPVAHDAARTLRLSARTFEVRGPDEWDAAFSAIVKGRAQGVIQLPDSTFYIGRVRLGDLARRHRLPLIGSRAESARAGALMAYGSNIAAEWRRGGVIVGKILNGTKPAEIPIEQPTEFELVLNRKTASALGLVFPASLLVRAEEVID